MRNIGFGILEAVDSGNGSLQLGNVLQQALKQGGAWRASEDWNIQPIKQVAHSFSGLKNLAATCYINSLLQQLFFIDSFSSHLLSI